MHGFHSDTHQHVCSSEEVAERVVQQVDEGRCVQVGVTHHLRGEQGLSGAAAEKATHHAIAHVHVVRHFLRRQEGEDAGETENHARKRRHVYTPLKGFTILTLESIVSLSGRWCGCSLTRMNQQIPHQALREQ